LHRRNPETKWSRSLQRAASAKPDRSCGKQLQDTISNGTYASLDRRSGRRGELHIRGTVDGFAIVFQPSALGLLFALPAQEFTDQDFDAKQVLGAIITRLHERLYDCRTFEERISVANQFLLQRVVAPPRDGISAAATDILRGAGSARIPAMANRADLSLGQFERRFMQQVGVSPKLFARIARFEAALDRMARSPQGSWTEVAHRFGYYDQMHMV
jgi:AraC-like DNA-binding protein